MDAPKNTGDGTPDVEKVREVLTGEGPKLTFAEAMVLVTGLVLRNGGDVTFSVDELLRYQRGYMLDIDMGADQVRLVAREDDTAKP